MEKIHFYGIIQEKFRNIFRGKIVTEGQRKELETEYKTTGLRYL
jgi:hypothetical protein